MAIDTGNDIRNDKIKQKNDDESYGKRSNYTIPALTSLDGMVFGMPPGTHVSDKIMKNSMPTAIITPCEPVFSEGLSLFRLNQKSGFTEYLKILNSVGFTLSGPSITVAYQADGFPTDSFNNEYGETFLDKFAQVASSGLGDLAQVMGWTSFKDVKEQGGNIAEAVGAGGVVNSLGEGYDKLNSKLSAANQNRLGGAVKMMQSIATGARVDFPQVWKNSSFQPSYTMTIRLYNPNPSSKESTMKYIVGPIAAIVALGLPKVAEDSATYKWPLLCKVRSPGIFHLNAAYISSIAIVKGGDNQGIAFNQAMSMCDLRIDFGSLYSSILAGPGTNELGFDRPTLGSYLEAIGGFPVTGSDGTRNTYSMLTEENKLVLVGNKAEIRHSSPITSVDDNFDNITSRVSSSSAEAAERLRELQRTSGVMSDSEIAVKQATTILGGLQSQGAAALDGLQSSAGATLNGLQSQAEAALSGFPSLSATEMPNVNALISTELSRVTNLTSSQMSSLQNFITSQLSSIKSTSQIPSLTELSDSKLTAVRDLAASEISNVQNLASSELSRLQGLISMG